MTVIPVETSCGKVVSYLAGEESIAPEDLAADMQALDEYYCGNGQTRQSTVK